MCTNSSCFYGTCMPSTTPGVLPACKCDEGFVRDYYFFHNDNCTIPEGTLLGIMVIGLVVHFGCAAYLMLERRTTKSTVRKTFAFAICYCIFQPFTYVGVYAQDGMYEVAGIACGLGAGVTGIWSWHMMKIVILPLFALDQQINGASHGERIARMFFSLSAATTIAFSGTIFVMAGVSRMSPAVYNGAAVGQLLVGNTFAEIFTGSYVYEASRFLKSVRAVFTDLERNDINREQRDKKAAEVLDKVASLKKQMSILMVNVALTLLPWITCQLVLGYSPFAWVFFTVASFGNVTQITQLTLALKNRKIVGTNSSSTPAPNPAQQKKVQTVSSQAGTGQLQQ